MTKKNTIFILIIFILTSCRTPEENQFTSVLRTTYDTPAKRWESEAIPLGNGYMGAMLFGGVESDLIQINEHTLWSGGPGKNPAYNGGHARTAEENRQNLQKARRVLQDKMSAFAQNNSAYIDNKGNLITSDYSPEDEELRAYIKGLMGDRADFGSYQSLGHIHITDLNEKPDTSSVKNYSAYQRSLDIDHAIASVSYMKDEVVFSREYFMTYPRNVMLIRYSADKPGSISRAIRVSSPQALADISLQDNVITLTGRPADHHENGLKFAQQLKVIPTGGSLKIEGDKIIVENADEFLILMSASTNYMMCMDNSFNYFSDKDPLFTVKSNLQKASGLSYRTLKSEHVKDYKSLYDNLTLSLGEYTQIPSKTTDCLLKEYGKTNTEEEDRYLEMLYYQFGRYLLISSSRENTLPANLQGIWADGLTPPWNSDYHTNINLQMNYWLAQQANLSDCHLPVIEYVKSLVPRGRETAQFYYCKEDGSDVRGWVIHHENNIWGNTAPGSWYTAFHFPTAAAWCCQDIWEYYQFNQDEKFLKENYDILLDAALFWVDNLWTDERDGKLVTNPAYSPEHGYYSIGTSADQAIITELFDFVIKASDVLGRNGSEIEEIRTAKNKLSGPKIGLGGQFMEWKDETAMDLTGDNHHRHVNHLHWLHPGSQIVPGRSEQEDSYVEAMKKTLLTRGDGGTGWSKAWKINFWARLRDGDHAYKMVSEILKESTLTNLFDTHPPFQIDGNFGATAGMTEMLLQSQGDCIEILPALPQAWNTGSFNGIKARGNFTLSADWKDAALKTLEIVSNSGNKCVVKYPGISTMRLKEQNGRNVDVKTINENVISFSTQKGKSYFFSVE